jgi:hypothetical protein
MENGLWNKILRFLGLVDPEPEESTPEIEDTYPVPRKKGKVLDIRTASQVKMVIYQPVTFDQTEEICDNLKNRKPVIVNLEKLENEVGTAYSRFFKRCGVWSGRQSAQSIWGYIYSSPQQCGNIGALKG